MLFLFLVSHPAALTHISFYIFLIFHEHFLSFCNKIKNREWDEIKEEDKDW